MKKLTKAAAKKRLTVFEADWLIPLVKEIDARAAAEPDGFMDPLDRVARDAFYDAHDYLRRVAVELGEER